MNCSYKTHFKLHLVHFQYLSLFKLILIHIHIILDVKHLQ